MKECKQFSMRPLDVRYIDDEAVENTIYLAMSYAIKEESHAFCMKFYDFMKSWDGYCTLRSDLERIFLVNRNLQRVIYNVAVRQYIDFSYFTALHNTNPDSGH